MTCRNVRKIAQKHAERADRADRLEHVGQADRIGKILPLEVDPAHPVHPDELVCHEVLDPGVDFPILGELAMAADVEPEAFMRERVAQPAHVALLLEEQGLAALIRQMTSGGETGRPGAQDDDAPPHVQDRSSRRRIIMRCSRQQDEGRW